MVRLTDRPDMTLDVYCGRKTTIQQQQQQALKRQTKIAADDILMFYFYLSKKIRLDFSCESSAEQRIHLKYQVSFSLKNNEKIFIVIAPITKRVKLGMMQFCSVVLEILSISYLFIFCICIPVDGGHLQWSIRVYFEKNVYARMVLAKFGKSPFIGS